MCDYCGPGLGPLIPFFCGGWLLAQLALKELDIRPRAGGSPAGSVGGGGGRRGICR